MTRSGPFSKVSAFLICIHKAFLHLHILLRIEKVEKREKTSERIPESCIHIHMTFMHVTVMRAVMNPVTVCIYFRYVMREDQASVKA
jgi:hypothetical protein